MKVSHLPLPNYEGEKPRGYIPKLITSLRRNFHEAERAINRNEDNSSSRMWETFGAGPRVQHVHAQGPVGASTTTLLSAPPADVTRIIHSCTFYNATAGAGNTNPVLWYTYGAVDLQIFQSLALAAGASDYWEGWFVQRAPHSVRLRILAGSTECDVVLSYSDLKTELARGPYRISNFSTLVSGGAGWTTIVPSPPANSQACVMALGTRNVVAPGGTCEWSLLDGATRRVVLSHGVLGIGGWDFQQRKLVVLPGTSLQAQADTGIWTPHAHWCTESQEVLSGA